MMQFEGRLFAGRLFAGRLFGATDDDVAAEDQTAFGPHHRRSWRPEPIFELPPRKRPKRRRRDELLFLGT